MKILLIALLAISLAGAGWYYRDMLPLGADNELAEGETEADSADGHGEAADASAAPVYLTLDPPFVVNFVHRGTLRYLQVSLDLKYHDANLLTRVSERMPEIRNDLILLFSNQEYEKLRTLEGKEMLRREIMGAINHVLDIDTKDKRASGEVFITNFVMQ